FIIRLMLVDIIEDHIFWFYYFRSNKLVRRISFFARSFHSSPFSALFFARPRRGQKAHKWLFYRNHSAACYTESFLLYHNYVRVLVQMLTTARPAPPAPTTTI